MTADRRIRISIDAVPLLVQPAESVVATFAEQGRSELIRQLPQTAGDRAEGRQRFEVVVGGWLFETITEDAARAELRDRVARQAAAHTTTANLTLRAQIPGRVVRLWVAAGETVERGQRLLAIEAMKMENEIRAPHGGVVEEISIEVGARVERNDELLRIG